MTTKLNRDGTPRKAYSRTGTRYANLRGTNVKRDYRAFTVRFDTKLYEKIQAKAQHNQRSVAGQMEFDIAELYK